jgi:hypothetical protein
MSQAAPQVFDVPFDGDGARFLRGPVLILRALYTGEGRKLETRISKLETKWENADVRKLKPRS